MSENRKPTPSAAKAVELLCHRFASFEIAAQELTDKDATRYEMARLIDTALEQERARAEMYHLAVRDLLQNLPTPGQIQSLLIHHQGFEHSENRRAS